MATNCNKKFFVGSRHLRFRILRDIYRYNKATLLQWDRAMLH